MANVIEILHGERAKALARAHALAGAIQVLSEAKEMVASDKATASPKQETRGAKKGAKRGPDSELTKARKRISASRRFGKEPAQADLDLVGVNEGATSAVAAE